MSSPFKYDGRLSSTTIRLAHLGPGSGDDALHCDIKTVTFDSQPTYEALSYVWGSEDDNRILETTLDGRHGQIEITKNLASALRHFRHPSTERVMWIDSVCINQHDREEQARQIPVMAEIFRRASQVLIWLGKELDSHDLTSACTGLALLRKFTLKILLLERILPASPATSSQSEKLAIIARQNPQILKESFGTSLVDSPEIEAVIAIFRKPWFYRAWTWQEHYVSKNSIFHLGRMSWHSEELLEACHLIDFLFEVVEKPDLHRETLTNALGMLSSEKFWQVGGGYLELSHLLEMRRGSSCKYPVDLVYSLLGAAHDVPKIPIDPEQPFETVFTKVVWHVLTQQKNLSVLRCLERNKLPSHLPTWVPDWRVRVLTRRQRLFVLDASSYRAAGSSHLSARLSKDCKIMSVSGIYCDKISAIKPANSTGVESWVSEMLSSPQQPQSRYLPTNESLEKAIRRVYLLDTTYFIAEHKNSRWQTDSHERYEELERNSSLSEAERTNQGLLSRYISKKMTRHTIFVTEKGRLGIGTNEIQDTDIIVVLLGGSTPFVLRPMNEAGHYKLVSDCYLHGFMDGQCLIEARKAANPSWNSGHTSWLEDLHEGELPFHVDEIHLH